jgi:hypothetical protein
MPEPHDGIKFFNLQLQEIFQSSGEQRIYRELDVASVQSGRGLHIGSRILLAQHRCYRSDALGHGSRRSRGGWHWRWR